VSATLVEAPLPRELEAPPERRSWPLLVGLYLAAVAYHVLQALGHRTPAVFADELLFAKLAQAVAAGDGFSLRGEPYFFPAPLAVLAQAPAWLVADAQSAYEAAKALNAAIMAAALFPAYWLARQLTSRTSALIAAAAAALAPGLLYHSYLMTDAVGYPAFLLAVAVMTRALARPSPRWELAVVAVSLLAVLSRTQFVVLPLAYLAAVGVVGWRRHVFSAMALAVGGLLVAVTGGVVFGQYLGAASLEYPLGDLVHWSVLSAGLLPFSAGWLVVPGALVGLGVMLARPQRSVDRGFAALVAVLAPLLVLEAALIATGDSHRVMERYLIYLVPLAFVACLAYVERGAPGRVVYAGTALALGGVALVYPLASEADYLFSFDSPTLSAYGELARVLSEGDAAAIFAGTALLGSIAVACLAPRRAVAMAGVVVLAAVGAAAYNADRAMTARTLAAFAAPSPDWLDEQGLGRVDYLALPGSQTHAGWNLETWNRDFGVPIALPGADPDPYGFPRARLDRPGRIAVEGGHELTRTVVVNDYGSRVELDGRVVAVPRPGLSLWQLSGPPRVRSLAAGLYHDGWANAVVRYRVWSRPAGGVFRVRLSLPAGRAPRTVTLTAGGGRRVVSLSGGDTVEIAVPAGPGALPPPLELRTDRSDFEGDGGPAPRLVAVRVSELAYESLKGPSRPAD
jgi:Dolichyl-phosphate-mannose-protein mannosyltransferase